MHTTEEAISPPAARVRSMCVRQPDRHLDALRELVLHEPALRQEYLVVQQVLRRQLQVERDVEQAHGKDRNEIELVSLLLLDVGQSERAGIDDRRPGGVVEKPIAAPARVRVVE